MKLNGELVMSPELKSEVWGVLWRPRDFRTDGGLSHEATHTHTHKHVCESDQTMALGGSKTWGFCSVCIFL